MSARSPAPSRAILRLEVSSAARSFSTKVQVRGAARQRLEAERAGAGEEIGDLQLLEAAEPAGEHREQALAGAVAGRPGGLARRRSSGRPRQAPAMILISSLRSSPHGEGAASRWRPCVARCALPTAGCRARRPADRACRTVPLPVPGRSFRSASSGTRPDRAGGSRRPRRPADRRARTGRRRCGSGG